MPLFSATDLRREYQQNYGYPTRSQIGDQLVESFTKSIDESFDIFLSHTRLDNQVIIALKQTITKLGFKVYLDVETDYFLEGSKVDKAVAENIKLRMRHCRCLFFATSTHYLNSVWMPWELGYFDGMKAGMAAVLPVSESIHPEVDYARNAYLLLYPYVLLSVTRDTNTEKLWIHDDPNTYVMFDAWLEGYKPRVHD